MKTTFKAFTYFIICYFLVSCNEKPKTTALIMNKETSVSKKIDSLGDHFLNEGKVLGFSIAVLQQGDTLYNKAFGYTDLEKTRPTTTETTYKIASITKAHVASMVLKLEEEGKLSLEDPLYKWLPDYPNKEDAQKIKIRHLISHTSGIPDYINIVDSLFLETGNPPNKDTYYNFVKDRPLLFDPDSGWSYSNTGFVLTAMIIEKATGSSYENEIQRIIADPMNFKHLRHYSESQSPQRSSTFEFKDSLIAHSDWDKFTWIRGDGGLTNTALDLAHFPLGLVNGVLLSNQSLKKMTEPQTLTNGIKVDYGLGLRMGDFEGVKIWGHTGGEATSWGMLKYMPEKGVSIAVLVNTNNTPHDALEIWGQVALSVLGKEIPQPKNLNIEAQKLENIVGEYSYVDYPHTRYISVVRYDDDQYLYVKRKDSDAKGVKLYYLGNNKFSMETYPMDRIIFHENTEGIILGYSLYANGSFRGLRTKVVQSN